MKYVPMFGKVVDSSLWEEEDLVVKVFLTILAKQDPDHIVRGSAYNIAQWARKTEKEVLGALEVLSSPDTKRLEPQPFDGRRIERVPDGWLILNGSKYQEEMARINRLHYQAQKQAEYRLRKKLKNQPQATERLHEQQENQPPAHD
jgi:hypothetical protein